MGALIDDKFTLLNHIEAAKRKVSQVIGSMYRLRKKVNDNSLLSIYNALILPHLTYCCEIWGNTYSTRLNKIVLLQTYAVRLIKAQSIDLILLLFLKGIIF